MASTTDSYIPRRLDDAWKIGLWDIDVAAAPFFFAMVGWLSHSALGFAIAIAAGIYVARRISRVKSDKHAAYALHWVFWHFPTNPATKMRSTPPSSCQRMIG